ncbi:MAG: tetratricopeptide repeat protein [bacterium]|jgi:tetratricopeptide (TPR) repeat protein|nr:tetratricopeptide repeat protein [bacterium]
MSGGFTEYLKTTTRVLLSILVFTLPLWVLPFPLEPLELNKQTLFVGLTCVAALAWLGSTVIQKRADIRRGWVNILPILWVTAFVVPAVYSIAPYTSWFGGERQEYTSVLTAVGAALLFYLLANTHATRNHHRRMHSTLLYSTTLLSFFAIVETLGGNILSSVSAGLVFNTVGTLTTFTAVLVIMNAFFLSSWVAHKKGDSLMNDGASGGIEQLATLFIVAATVFFLLVLDDAQLWILTIVSLLSIFITTGFKAQYIQQKGKLALPGILLAVALGFWFWLPGLQLNLPLEVTPSAELSQNIAEETLQAHSSSYGSGPGTYILNFAQFKGTGLNETDFWDTRFDRANNFFFTLIPTIGVFGITLLAVFAGLLGARALIQVVRPQERDEWLETFVHLSPWLTLLASIFLVNWNMTLMGLFAVFSGLLASQVLQMEHAQKVKENAKVSLLLSALLALLSLAFLIGIFLTAQRYAAQLAFTRAVELDRTGASMEEVVVELDKAATLNKYNDTYYRNLGEALMYRLDEVLAGVTSIDKLSIESAQYLQSLTAASVNSLATATDLSPNQVLNWLSRGFVYRELVPVMGEEAAQLAISSYEQATQLEPANPSHWVELAKAQLVAVEALRPLADVDPTRQVELELLMSKAETNLLQAIDLKGSYAPSHFQLAVAYARSGRLDDAIGKMESVAQYNQLDVGVHFELAMLYLQRLVDGDLERAQEALEHTVTLAPTHGNAHWFLASVYEQLGNIPAAVHEVEVVAELNPNNELVQNRLRDLLSGQLSTEIHTTLE